METSELNEWANIAALTADLRLLLER